MALSGAANPAEAFSRLAKSSEDAGPQPAFTLAPWGSWNRQRQVLTLDAVFYIPAVVCLDSCP